MLRSEPRNSGIQGIALVAVTYTYFLIFAQFAFLQRLGELSIAGSRFKIVMGAMAIGGIIFSLLMPRLNFCHSPGVRLRVGLGAAGVAAFFSLLPLNFGSAVVVSFLVGASLGLLTVTLAANLRELMGNRAPLIKVGVATGVGYFACNFPPLFTASPKHQAETAGVLCLAALCLPLLIATEVPPQLRPSSLPAISFLRVLAAFFALVWLDSAAFLIIQNTPALKSGTWQGSMHLWTNGVLHLAAALVSAWWLRRKGLSIVLSGAFAALGAACLLLNFPDRILLASVFYPIGVSFYSVALVAYPSLLAPASSPAERGRLAGWIYAVAGWAGSVLGIGMAQNLGRVPLAFVLAAGAVILLPLLLQLFMQRRRELALTAIVLLAALGFDRALLSSSAVPLSPVERGREVYISEGCISCHSQYVRPGTSDVAMWGPVESLEEIHQQRPPLIGNRRQGPDLSEVGVRRSALWLKAHFYAPAEVSGASIMPSFGFLFRDPRGGDLVAYLESLHGAGAQQHIAEENHWKPAEAALYKADAAHGQQLYLRFCATCHSPEGRTRSAWQSDFKRVPTNLVNGPFHDLPTSGNEQDQLIRLEQIAKFGIPGTDMPGHEYLSDNEIASVSLWVLQNIAPPAQHR